MLSSLNHHLSVLHLRVHHQYLEWLTTGNATFAEPGPGSEQPPWHALELRRTRWFDLLQVSDRREVFDGLWSLFAWMMR